MFRIFLFSIIILQCYLFPVFAHSVNYTISKGESIVLKAGFGKNDPMSYAFVKIFSPENKGIEYQNGRTDKNGCFSFIPDKPGKWTITVIDETGHGLKEIIDVDKKLELAEPKSHGLTMMQKLFVAVCLVWGVAGTILYIREKNK